MAQQTSKHRPCLLTHAPRTTHTPLSCRKRTNGINEKNKEQKKRQTRFRSFVCSFVCSFVRSFKRSKAGVSLAPNTAGDQRGTMAKRDRGRLIGMQEEYKSPRFLNKQEDRGLGYETCEAVRQLYTNSPRCCIVYVTALLASPWPIQQDSLRPYPKRHHPRKCVRCVRVRCWPARFFACEAGFLLRNHPLGVWILVPFVIVGLPREKKEPPLRQISERVLWHGRSGRWKKRG